MPDSTSPADLLTALASVQARAQRLRRIIEAVPDGILVFNDRGIIDAVNPAAERLFGYCAEDLHGLPVTWLMKGRFARLHERAITAFLGRRGVAIAGKTRETVGRRRDGDTFPVEVTVSALAQEGERLYIALVRDITNRKQTEDYLHYLADHDSLTGLANRSLIKEHMAVATVRAARDGHKAALLIVDLDHFKNINDSLGHAFGDRVLKAVTARLVDCADAKMTVGRPSGDEFTVLMPAINDVAEAAALAARLQEALSLPLEVDGRRLFLTASIGIALYPDHSDDISSLFKRADMAMHHAKRAGRNSVRIFTEQLSAEAQRRAALEDGLRHALERGEISLNYQPKIDLATGDLAGVEALLRWNSADLGSVSPAEFIPVAEECGLIVPLGEWVLREACIQTASWQIQGVPPLRMAVNLSARQFRQADLVGVVAAILEECGLPPGLLELELTESMLVENAEDAIRIMHGLKRLGVHLSLDDFGTGYSSLAYLKRFPLDALKIDRSFVKDLPADADGAVIVRAIIHMARNLGLKIVAEGIEEAAQVALLRAEQCDQGQGYFYARPMPARELARFALERREQPSGDVRPMLPGADSVVTETISSPSGA